MRIFTILLLLTHSLLLEGQPDNPFTKLRYDKVVMYDFDGTTELNLSIVDNNGQLAKSIKKQIFLDKATIEKLNKRLGDKTSFGEQPAACFEPHLGIVYYLGRKIVGHITICLSCHRLSSNINLPAQRQGKEGKGKNKTYTRSGLSGSFEQFIKQLIIKSNFSLGPLPPSA
jgi:hypothetical protein